MFKIFGTRVHGANSGLKEECQRELDRINKISRTFYVEEYYNETITVYVCNEGFYLYTTSEVQDDRPYVIKSVECTLSRARNIEELYKNLRDKRIALDIEDVKEIMVDIEEYAKEIGLI